MTPEELNRAMEFIIQSQARLAAAQEREREDRLEFQEWSKNVTDRVVGLVDSQARLLDIQSRRLDRQDKFYQDSLQRTEEFQGRALNLLHMILDRLPPLRAVE
jgi:hypothetical protein